MSVTFSGTKVDPTSKYGHSIVRLPNEKDDDIGFNLANGNAIAFLRLLEVSVESPADLFGDMPIADMVRHVQKARASFDYRVDALIREPIDTQGTRGPRIIAAGIDEAYFTRRLAQFETLLADLIEAGADHITWG